MTDKNCGTDAGGWIPGWPPYSALAAENKMLSDRIEEYEIFLCQYKMEQRFGDWKRGRDAGLAAPSKEPPTFKAGE